jgi:hypothetical protein
VIKDDLHIARTTAQTLDQEKNHLLGELDLKSNQHLHFTQELNTKIRQIDELNMLIAELQSALE